MTLTAARESGTIRAPILASLPVGMDTLFANLLKRISKQGIDTKINRASTLKSLCWRMISAITTSWRRLTTKGNPSTASDALRLATAILYRADKFHTFDESNGRNSLGLLPLSGNVAGHNLTICKPIASNPELDLRRST